MEQISIELLSSSSISASPDGSKRRVLFLGLIMASMVLLGVFFAIDIPAAVQKQLMRVRYIQHFEINDFQYSLFYSVYCIPNIILPLVGGYMVDSIGVRTCIVLFCSISLIGQGIFAIGVGMKSFYLALFGRVVFGLGGENILGKDYSVAESTLLSQWFRGKHLAFALGIDTSFARLGTVTNFLIEPFLYSKTGDLIIGMWFGFGMMSITLICGLILIFLDKSIHTATPTVHDNTINLSDIFSFGTNYWLCNLNCFLISISILAFSYIATSYYETRFNFNDEESGLIIVTTN